ncbi:hypothetical protein BSK56_25820 [Paenibacillus borealis]|uniref:Phospholipase/carboxylesterase/thioesterase domain-containing protein n=1 Tax=Paenibacillus borealis TaxID=160799 RepID=A0ABX3H3Y3_PAEBO|nr:dienelactone hydrolase family protein [Paenibacillus borealis]OMD42316.1 hypothetical protein BSK56_25820 [Paenibacillus borealis]
MWLQCFRQDDRSNLSFFLWIPEGYSEEEVKEWPLLLFLHGSNKRGNDPEVLSNYGLHKAANDQLDFPFFVISPHCPDHTDWVAERGQVLKLIHETADSYQIDRTRIYGTGFSMGGEGIWDLSVQHPDLFAAVAPIAGWYDKTQVRILKNLPIWNFHGEEDLIIPIERSEELVQALEQIGGNIIFTKYPGEGHNIIDLTYSNRDLFKWLLSHRVAAKPRL